MLGGNFTEEPLIVLDHNKIVPEIRRGFGGCESPRNYDKQGCQKGNPRFRQETAVIAFPEQKCRDAEPGKRKRKKPFYEESAADCESAEKQPEKRNSGRLLFTPCKIEKDEFRRNARSEHSVQNRCCADDEKFSRDHESQDGVEGQPVKTSVGFVVPEPACDEPCQEKRYCGGKRVGEPDREVALPENLLCRDFRPVTAGWFFIIGHIGKLRDEPCVIPDHLTRNLCVTRFVRDQKRTQPQRNEIEQNEQQAYDSDSGNGALNHRWIPLGIVRFWKIKLQEYNAKGLKNKKPAENLTEI